MSRFFIDVNIPMYAAGTTHPLREPSQGVIRAIATGQLDAVTDAEVFQEILYRYLRINEREKGFGIFDLFYRIMLGRILPIEGRDVQQSRALAEKYLFLSPRDLIHLAVMLRHRVQKMITADSGFDAVEEVDRIEPSVFPPP
ncbi:type II toxin-antitoxin system VapC family toxin [Acidobacteria bacterium AH-259-G07]|nr:type II toxin-antitoxin system VapC family toxin [Acidobacteria bacterium AH-259-G07]